MATQAVSQEQNNNVMLNSVEHKDLKVITDHAAQYGDNVWYALTFPVEFRSVQAHYPIFFQKDPQTGRFFSVALFGFKDRENLFLDKGQWQASYIPLAIKRQPFLIGSQNIIEDGVQKVQQVLHIDLNHPRISTQQGEPLFLEFGGNTPFLDTAADMLDVIHHGLEDSEHFIDALLKFELLESFTLDVELNNGNKHQMIGFYTINEDKLKTLASENLAQLHDKGYLQAIYMTIASQANIRTLLDKKNNQLEG
ncbi:SapC family protein [Shewanella sp. KX20019]|uniref:SapC family protein n=1 Tax=Shewanella sp. KX20019 TaxID=2803864 RepID=UPI00192638BB|nr:SapC family protein [Shewanella sp. KX20019]QQX81846.1 SapC family protein [Shewanella sp. KX20019]